MHAYLMTGVVRRAQVGPGRGIGRTYQEYQIWVGCHTLVVPGETREEAQKKFEASLCPPAEGESPSECEIQKVISAQFLPELFTEFGPAPLDWTAIANQVSVTVQSLPVDDFEQGYWVDMAQAVPPGPLSASVEDLQREVSEDISSGLNWSADKQFIYVLSLMTPPKISSDGPESGEMTFDSEEARQTAIEYYNFLTENPLAADREAAAIIQARNSVVAAWLWRSYAAEHQLAALPFRLDPWCGMLELPDADGAGSQASGQADSQP